MHAVYEQELLTCFTNVFRALSYECLVFFRFDYMHKKVLEFILKTETLIAPRYNVNYEHDILTLSPQCPR